MEYLNPKDGVLPFKFKLFLLIQFFCIPAYASSIPVIRVMVERDQKSLNIHGFDLVLRDAGSDRQVLRIDRRANVSLNCSLSNKIHIQSNRRKVYNSGPLKVESLGGFLRVNQKQYREALYVYSFNKECLVVNHVDLEKYIAGLLNSEMSAGWNIQALKAQAIAARSYAIYQMQESGTVTYPKLYPPFDLVGTVKDQVYEGAHQERYQTLQAVQQTKGMILTYHKAPVKAFYHSTCGGATDTPDQVWGAKYKAFQSVKCPYCVKSPRFHWTYEVSRDVFDKILKQEKIIFGALQGISVKKKTPNGRIQSLVLQTTLGSIPLSALQLRNLVGTTHLRSTEFSIHFSEKKLSFLGQGAGHGVGMCQWGAKGMADEGHDFKEILKHYYPKTEVTKIY